MQQGIVYHPKSLEHDTGPAHAERPERISAICERLAESGLWSEFEVTDPEMATDVALLRVHAQEHLRSVRERCERGDAQLDGDTVVCSDSERIARTVAGGGVHAVDQVMGANWSQAFLLARPPGHHAESDRAMGFCLYNNIAVAARYLQAVHKLERIAIVDWDVHHGNGTQHSFEADPGVFFASLHQHPHYPGTGAVHERGRGEGEGATLNCPLPAGTRDAAWLKSFDDQVLPALESFRPQFVLVSAGFDAHADDPLSGTRLSESAYAHMTRQLLDLAHSHCQGRLVSFLEGGYELNALAACVETHLTVLREEGQSADLGDQRS